MINALGPTGWEERRHFVFGMIVYGTDGVIASVFLVFNISDLVLLCSPGRSCGTFDNEIVMMNHVYKERFPKVCYVLFAPPSCSFSHTASLGDL